jgi:hypothetical protein
MRLMRDELVAHLCERYPLIFADLAASGTPHANGPRSPLAARGFECGDGWFDLIEALCCALQAETRNGSPQVVAFQVKEKFGALRFYARGADERQAGARLMAELLSGRICEVCGNRGGLRRRDSGWMSTRCEDHLES